jgi:hypothetical protein
MKPYSLTTQFKSWSKETLLSILDALEHPDHHPSQNKAELAGQLIDCYIVSDVLNVANKEALHRLFEVIGKEEIYKVAKPEGDTNISYLHLTEDSLRGVLNAFQESMLDAAFALNSSENTEESARILTAILLDTVPGDAFDDILGT